MLAQVVRNVQRGHGAPGIELLGHPGIVYLVHNDIEPVDLRESVHLELTAPSSVLSHPVDVVLDVLVILNEKLVQLFVLLDVVGALRSELLMMRLVSLKLVAERPEKAIAISTHFFDF